MYFCVKCGKKIEEGVFCDKHMEKDEKIFKNLKLKACLSGRYYFNRKWTKYSSPELFLSSVLKKVYKKSFNIKLVNETSKKLVFEVDNHIIDIKIEKSDVLLKQNTQYFEGVIQFRYKKDMELRIKKTLDKQLIIWEKKEIFVTKISKQSLGLDWYVSNKRAMSLFADQLNRRFGARIGKHAKLFSRNKQTSKDIFRLNVLVEFPSFEEGAVVLVKNKLAKVIQLRRNIKVLDIKTGKTFGFTLNDDIKLLKSWKTRVSIIKPEVRVLHPETFQEIVLSNQNLSTKVSPGEKVKVLLYEGKCFLLP